MNQTQLILIDTIISYSKTATHPMTYNEIVNQSPKEFNPRTIRASLNSLVAKGYLRRGINIKNNSCYIIVRTLTDYEKQELQAHKNAKYNRN